MGSEREFNPESEFVFNLSFNDNKYTGPGATMKLLDLTFSTPEENLACDEILLHTVENGQAGPVLRFWEPDVYYVVAGYSNNIETEVAVSACARDGVKILRRCTGGGTVLQGPGCLNYALVLPVEECGPLATITGTNRFIMNQNRSALAKVVKEPVEIQGHTDLAIHGRKFSGNSQRRLRRALLFHGCFLLGLEMDLIERYLRMPSRVPLYRLNRSHSDFLVNLDIPADVIKRSLREAWNAVAEAPSIPRENIAALAREKYASITERDLHSSAKRNN
jgi:lipoate---protein ligase